MKISKKKFQELVKKNNFKGESFLPFILLGVNMARSSEKDPLEKFRFRVTVLSLDLSVDAAITNIAALSSNGTVFNENLAVVSRSGFSRATLPKANVKVMTYRENVDNLRSIKVPGLVTYENVTLSRGVTESRDLYNWYRLVNEELALLSVAGELQRDQNFIPTQSNTFRKDVVIEVLDREGEPIKAWYLFNCWPVSYTPGDALDAQEQEKLVESLELTYEHFLELEGGPEGLAKELARGLAIAAAGAAIDRFASSVNLGV
jgi:phage tail-like protein